MRLTYIIREIRNAWNEDIGIAEYCVSGDLYHAKMDGERVPEPNAIGIRLMALWQKYVTWPLWIIRMERCDHPNMIDEGYGGPDSGCDAGSCPDCGFSFHIRMY